MIDPFVHPWIYPSYKEAYEDLKCLVSVMERRRMDRPRLDRNEDQESDKCEQNQPGTLYGSGNYYVQSTRKMLEMRKFTCQQELDMINTALENLTPEVDKMLVVQSVLDKLNMNKTKKAY